MKKYFVFFISLLFISCFQSGNDKLTASLEPSVISVLTGETSAVTVKINIPKQSHIYGNPKGPGIGKATELLPAPSKHIRFSEPKFLPTKQHIALGDDDFVYIYEDSTEIVLPFTVENNAVPGSRDLSLALEVLLCTDNYCEPIIVPLTAKLNIIAKEGAAKQVAQSAVSEKVSRVETENVLASENVLISDIIFKPVYFESSAISGIWQAILFGLLAGFILNFMPCVLPVVSIKILSFVKQAGESRRKLLILGGLFAAGILFAFFILAMFAAFAGYSWGGLFQHKAFLTAMCAIVFLLALSMLGVFTLNVPAFAGRAAMMRNGYTDAFFKGLLATLLATPCSGPLLGGTLAWTMVQPPIIIFMVFISIGFGMALPYLLLCAFPQLAKWVPRPGAWLRGFDLVMGFLLIFTAVYLISIFARDDRLAMIAFLAFVALAASLYGRFGDVDKSNTQRLIVAMIAVFVLAGGYFLSFNYLFEKQIYASDTSVYSHERLIQNRDTGTISVIKFTAAWCPNCMFVESVSLNTEQVVAKIKHHNIDFMKADITRHFPEAEKLLHSLGSRSIPFLAVLPSGKAFTEPICLRDMYSESDVLKALEKAIEASDK